MRWGYRVLTFVAATTLVLSSCSDDSSTSSSDAAARSSTTSSSSSTSTSSSTTATPLVESSSATTIKGGTPATTIAKGTRTTRAAAPVTTRAPATTTIPCTSTLSSSGLRSSSLGGLVSPDPTDERFAVVTVVNTLGVSVVVSVAGEQHTLPGGGSQQLSLPPTHGGDRVTATAALASSPGNRFSYSIELLPNSSQTLTAKAAGKYDCDAGHNHRPVYLVQSNLNLHS